MGKATERKWARYADFIEVCHSPKKTGKQEQHQGSREDATLSPGQALLRHKSGSDQPQLGPSGWGCLMFQNPKHPMTQGYITNDVSEWITRYIWKTRLHFCLKNSFDFFPVKSEETGVYRVRNWTASQYRNSSDPPEFHHFYQVFQNSLSCLYSMWYWILFKIYEKTAGSIAASELQGTWFNHEHGLLSVWRFACSPYVCMDFPQALWFLPSSQKHEICVYHVFISSQW